MIYIIGSLRNKNIPVVAQALRAKGYDVFDDWYSAGPEADDKWREHQKFKGLTYAQAIAGPAARAVFEFDKRNLDKASIAVLVLPAGKSGHLELGYCAGAGKRTYILFDAEPADRWDVMYQFATGIAFSTEQLIELIKKDNYLIAYGADGTKKYTMEPRRGNIPYAVRIGLLGRPVGWCMEYNNEVYRNTFMGPVKVDKHLNLPEESDALFNAVVKCVDEVANDSADAAGSTPEVQYCKRADGQVLRCAVQFCNCYPREESN